jgi:hypothetical protein
MTSQLSQLSQQKTNAPTPPLETVSCAKEDFLDQDPTIRGQKYVCLSFLSPEDVIKQKDIYFLERFLGDMSKEMVQLWNTTCEVYKENVDFVESLNKLKEKYDYLFDDDRIRDEFNSYKSKNNEDLESAYLEKNNFQTTIRGIKVRGSYDTMREAEIRAQVIKRMDNVHNVYIAEVGCWCPWAPNPDDITNQEYAESSLNTLMKSYVKNHSDKDEFYLQRKETLKEEVAATNRLKRARIERETDETEKNDVETMSSASSPFSISASASASSSLPSINDTTDPWLAKKRLENVREENDEGDDADDDGDEDHVVNIELERYNALSEAIPDILIDQMKKVTV